MADMAGNVLVTGGAKRIGRAIVEDLAAHGFGVAIHCNHARKAADDLAATINAGGGRAVVVQADLADMAAADGLVADATAALGPITLLVNNASVFEVDSVTDFGWEVWDRHFALHVKAPALLAKNFAAALPENAEGLIVNMIDQRVLKPTPQYFSYSLSKAALWTATQHNGAGAGATHPRQCHRPRPDGAQCAPGRRGLSGAQVDGLIMKHGPAFGEFGATIRYLWIRGRSPAK
jgi:NAD(P)-dependent dehydrogenase (short-subunit alcohol dehydrogenase family)